MKRVSVLIYLLLTILLFPCDLNAEIEPEPYLKVIENSSEVTLLLSIREFKCKKNPSLPTISLISASHIGSKKYYQKLQEYLDKETVVLFEGAGAPEFTCKISSNEEKWEITKEAMDFLTRKLEKYKKAINQYPENLSKLINWLSTQNGRDGVWSRSAIMDRWNNKIEYYSTKNKYILTSYGSDCKPGGEDDARDIIMTCEVKLKEESGSSLQTEMAHSLGLEFQLKAINYNRLNFKSSDISKEDLDKILNGEYIDGSSVKDEKERKELAEDMKSLIKTMRGTSFMGKIAKYFFMIIGKSEKAKELIKFMIITSLNATKGDILKMAAVDPKMRRLFKILVEYRNNIVYSNLKKYISKLNSKENIGVFFGAGHMFGIEKIIRNKLGYEEFNEKWIPTFSVSKKKIGFSDYELKYYEKIIEKQLGVKVRDLP